jgi:uncharacterized membrane protein
MTWLRLLEVLFAGVWLGSYLFTTLVVSPGLGAAIADEGMRARVRSAVGRRYGMLSLPLLLAWLVVILLQGLNGWGVVRLVLLLLLIAAIFTHGYVFGSRMQRLAELEADADATLLVKLHDNRQKLRRNSYYVTLAALTLSLLLALLAVT